MFNEPRSAIGVSRGRGITLFLLAASAWVGNAACNRPFTAEQALTLTAPAEVERVVVRNLFGDVAIEARPGIEAIEAHVREVAKGATPGEAERALAEIHVSLKSSDEAPDTLVARSEHPRASSLREYRVRWHIVVPPSVYVDAESGFGDLAIDGAQAGARVFTDFGGVAVTAAGALDLVTGFGDVTLRLLEANPGDVVVRTEFGDIEVDLPEERTGRIVADTDFGSVHVRLDAAELRNLRQRKHHFDAELGGAAEPLLDLYTDFGDVVVRCY